MANHAAHCRAMIASFGAPAQRDLDFGRQVIRYLEQFTWPDGVVVEDLSYAAHLVLHRLHELSPVKLVLVGATARGVDAPGLVRRRSIDAACPTSPASPEVVQEQIGQSVGGAVDLDHTLAVLGHWGALPADTVLIEVEAADCGFGTGFSEELAPSFDTILSLLREELGEDGPELGLSPDDFSTGGSAEAPPAAVPGAEPQTGTLEGFTPLVDYAHRRREARLEERHRGGSGVAMVQAPAGSGLRLAGRHRPWAIGLDGASDWYDVIPLDHGAFGLVMGSVAGRGVEAAGRKSDMRVAVQAYAVLEGRFPSRVIACLDRMADTNGLGRLATIAYLTVQPDTGEVRVCSAGQVPPLLLTPAGGRFLHDSITSPVGAPGAGHRTEVTARLGPGATLLLCTRGLVVGPTRRLGDGLAGLVDAAVCGPSALEALCDHVMGACLNRQRRDDDASLVGLRLDQPSWDRISAE